jgi:CHAD domain-containing protein
MHTLESTLSNADSVRNQEGALAVCVGSLPESLRINGFVTIPLQDRSQVPTSGRSLRTVPNRSSQPTMVGSCLAHALQKRWESYREQLRSCREGFTEETIHQLSVATRRLISQLAMIETVAPGATVKRVRRSLKRRLKALGELRDTHVQRLFIERRLERYRELTLVWASLHRREHRLEKSVAAEVQGFKTRKLGRWISGLGLRLELDSGATHGPQGLANAVEQAMGQAFAEVVKRRRAIDPSQPSTIHRTRIAFKKFRYMVESLSPELTGLSKSDLRALARYQRRMGIIQDLEVMQQCISVYVQKHMGTEERLRPFYRYLQAGRARRLRSFLKSADDLFSFWPPSRVKTHGYNGAALYAA